MLAGRVLNRCESSVRIVVDTDRHCMSSEGPVRRIRLPGLHVYIENPGHSDPFQENAAVRKDRHRLKSNIPHGI